MRMAEFKDLNDKVFALSPNNIKRVRPLIKEGYTEAAEMVTCDNEVYVCRFPFDATIAIINNALMDNHQYLTTSHRFPSCARN